MVNKTFADCIELIKDRASHMPMERAIVVVLQSLSSQEQGEIGIDYDKAVAALLRKPAPIVKPIELAPVYEKQKEAFQIPKSTHVVKKVVKKGK